MVSIFNQKTKETKIKFELKDSIVVVVIHILFIPKYKFIQPKRSLLLLILSRKIVIFERFLYCVLNGIQISKVHNKSNLMLWPKRHIMFFYEPRRKTKKTQKQITINGLNIQTTEATSHFLRLLHRLNISWTGTSNPQFWNTI